MNWLAIAAAALAALRQILALLTQGAARNASDAEVSIRNKAQSYDRLQKAIRIRDQLNNGGADNERADGGMRDAPYRRQDE